MHRKLFFICILLTINYGFSQEKETSVNYNYTTSYSSNSLSVDRQHVGAVFSFGNFTSGINLNSYSNTINDYPYDIDVLDRALSLEASLKYTYTIQDNYGFSAEVSPKLVNNQNEGVHLKNITPRASINFIKKLGNSEFVIGASYTDIMGKPQVLPVGYFKAEWEKLSLKIGFPDTNIKYNITGKHSIAAIAGNDSYYLRVFKDNYIATEDGRQLQLNEAEMVNLYSGLEYKFTSDYWTAYFSAGKSLYANYSLTGNDYSIKTNFNGNFYVSMGIKYNLNF